MIHLVWCTLRTKKVCACVPLWWGWEKEIRREGEREGVNEPVSYMRKGVFLRTWDRSFFCKEHKLIKSIIYETWRLPFAPIFCLTCSVRNPGQCHLGVRKEDWLFSSIQTINPNKTYSQLSPGLYNRTSIYFQDCIKLYLVEWTNSIPPLDFLICTDVICFITFN